MRWMLPLLMMSLVSVGLMGCGEILEEVASSDDSSKHLAQGFTPCGDFLASPGQTNTCNPNQYCADRIFSECAMGCLSEFNCTENQFCDKAPGEDVGTCVQLH